MARVFDSILLTVYKTDGSSDGSTVTDYVKKQEEKGIEIDWVEFIDSRICSIREVSGYCISVNHFVDLQQ